MHVRHVTVLAVAVALAVGVGGCLQSPSSGPNAPPGNESFTVEMTGNATYSVYVATHLYADRPESVTFEYENGSAREFALPPEQGLIQGNAPDGLRSVATPEDDGGVYFEGPPAFTASANDVAPMETVVFVVRVDGSNQVAAWGIANCDGHVDRVTLDATGRTVTVGGLACSN
jgi:hypothetical protein